VFKCAGHGTDIRLMFILWGNHKNGLPIPSNHSFCPLSQIILHFINVSKKGNTFNESWSQDQLPEFPIIIIIIMSIVIIFGYLESVVSMRAAQLTYKLMILIILPNRWWIWTQNTTHMYGGDGNNRLTGPSVPFPYRSHALEKCYDSLGLEYINVFVIL